MTISALALLCIGGMTVAPAGAADAAAVGAESCEDVTYRWGGDVVVDAVAPSYATGVEVPAVDGATLTVVGVSADGLDDAGVAHVLDVHVGGMRATAGAAIAGGGIVVSSTSPAPRRIVGVTVVVRRCAVVASAAPVPPVVGTAGDTTAGAGAIEARQLPATGADEWRQSVIGALVIGVGATLLSLGRRRPASR